MCGIVGYLNINGRPIDPDKNYLPAMCQSIHHRGPDDQGQLITGPVALGMTRLSIIDLSGGHQPISNEDGSIWIVFNGEIYNYQDLQKLVLSHGHKLKTSSDTEVIVHLYEEFGIDCLQYLEGMFAFAIWDNKNQKLFLARDRMGEKPLHYATFNEQLIFGSELKGILAHPHSQRQLSAPALQKYLACEYVPAPWSMFEGIHKLLPAHYLLVEHGNIKTGCYWKPNIPQQLSEKDAQVRLIELLSNSIKGRLIADVPVGIFLSGGIDSSSIAALASRMSSGKIKTFSIGFEDSSFDESEQAQAMANYLGTEHYSATFSPKLAKETLEELWNYFDEPLADASIIPTYFLSKLTKQHVKVALAGEGGDELFGGYPTYPAHRLAELWQRIPKLLRHSFLEPTIKNLPVSMNNLSFDYKIKRFIEYANQSPVSRHLRWMGALPLSTQIKLIKSSILTLTKEQELFPDAISLGNGNDKDVVSQIMHIDMITYLPDDLLVKSDRASMAASLEVRLPYLAYPLVEFTLSCPSSYKIKGMTTKHLLKQALKPHLPEHVLRRPKKGFGIPVAKWLKNEFKPVVDELLSETYVRKQGIFEWAHIAQLLAEHTSDKFDRRKELWTILMFQWWWNKFFVLKA